MADSFISKLITELVAKTTASDTDLIPIADSSGNFFKMTFAKLKELITNELNTKITTHNMTAINSGSTAYVTSNVRCFKNVDGTYTITGGLIILKEIDASNKGGILTGFPFTSKYDLTVPIFSESETNTRFLVFDSGTSKLRLVSGKKWTIGNYHINYVIQPAFLN